MVNAMTELVLHGVGNGVVVYSDGSTTPIKNAQDVSIEITATDEDVYGGDGLFPILSFIKEKGGSLKITNATTSINHLKITQGATINRSQAQAFMVSDVKTPGSGTLTLEKTSGIDVSSVTCIKLSDGQALKRVTGEPAEGEFSVTEAGVVKVDESLDGELEFSYFYASANALSAKLATNAIPGVVEYRHHLVTEDVDGKKYNVYFRVYKAKCSGSFSFNMQRGTASAPSLEFKLLDPKRADNAFLDYTIEEVVETA